MRTILAGPTVAEAIVEVLKRIELDRVFGLPGIQNIELFDALVDAPFDTVTPTNESAVVFMADAHARLTGKLGVAVVTAGPGLTNALTGVAEAKLDSSPLLVLVSSTGETNGKSFQLHQISQRALLEPLVKGFFAPERPAEVPQAVLQAARLAQQGEPGPTVVELPSRLLMERGGFEVSTDEEPKPAPDLEVRLDHVAERLRCSPSVGFYVGAGAMGACQEVRALAELLQAPVATTISGRGVLPEDHPLSVGYGFGRSGTAAAWQAFRGIRTLVAIGCKYTEPATGGYGVKPPAEHVHIDINAASIGANYPTSLPVVSEAKAALTGLLARLKKHGRSENTRLQFLIRQAREKAEARVVGAPTCPDRVSPARFLRCLRRLVERETIMVTDCGTHQFWALNDWPVYAPRSFFAPADFQAMGFSIPAAIAAKLGAPQRRVVSLVGDGGFLMSGFECLNAVRWGAKIVVVVFHDGAWGVIQETQQRVYRRAPFSSLPSLDFPRLAESFGMKWVRIAADQEIERGLQEALTADAPVLVDVQVNYAERPPYMKGAGRQMLSSLPLRLQTSIALRLGKRYLLPPRTGRP